MSEIKANRFTLSVLLCRSRSRYWSAYTKNDGVFMNTSNPLPKATYYIPAVLLLLALFPLPYGFYTLLRLVVTICAGVIAYHHWQSGGKGLAFSMGFVALLFNPLIPVYLSREIWAPIDLGLSVFFGVVGYRSSKA
jgi:Family of unknown function (DUF6804)